MSVLESLKKPPFNLSEGDLKWVADRLAGLSMDDRIRQLFVHISMGDDPAAIRNIMATKPGGLCRFIGDSLDNASNGTRLAMELSDIPPFVTGDLEGGGHLSPAMTRMQNPLGLAAADDLALSEASTQSLAEEGRQLGYNWSFTPVVDVNQNFQSAIVGTRSFGSNIDTIIEQAVLHVKTMQKNGIAATAKHWPGEGYDQRDQHLVTTINPLSFDEWEKVYGRIYRAMIEAGVMSVMSAHIALPCFAEKSGVPEGLERYRPASLSKLLNENLLRQHLGFNGLIVSDATSMAGMGAWADRASVVPEVIANGCDVFLFSDDMQRDFEFMKAGVNDGRLTEARLEEAVTRILGLKAAVGLHRKSLEERVAPLDAAKRNIRSEAHLATARQTTSKSITLVKNRAGTLPLSPSKHRRVTIINNGAPPFFPGQPRKKLDRLEQCLRDRGFVISPYDPQNQPAPENTDLLIYAFAVESSLRLSHIFLDWKEEHPGFRQSMERYWHDVPTVMISFGNPYYLFDAPRVPAYINAYSTIEDAQEAVVRKMLGDEPFEGVSPVDAFCGLPDARY